MSQEHNSESHNREDRRTAFFWVLYRATQVPRKRSPRWSWRMWSQPSLASSAWHVYFFNPVKQQSRNHTNKITPSGGWQTSLQNNPDELKRQYCFVSGTVHNISEKADRCTKTQSLNTITRCGFFSWVKQPG